MPQHAIEPHLRLRRRLKHLLRRRNDIHDPIRERLFARPAVRFKEHFPRDLRPQFEPWQRADAVEVQAEAYWWLCMSYKLTE